MIATNTQTDLLAHLLNAAALRHEAIAQNVANVNTPGFQGLEVEFEASLRQVLGANNLAGALQVQPQVVTSDRPAQRNDGNNVDIDREMGDLNKNQLLFKVYTQILASQLAQYRSAISGH